MNRNFDPNKQNIHNRGQNSFVPPPKSPNTPPQQNRGRAIPNQTNGRYPANHPNAANARRPVQQPQRSATPRNGQPMRKGPVPGAGTRAPAAQAQKRPVKKETGNSLILILLGVFVLLLLLLVIIFAVQSCSRDGDGDGYKNNGDDVILNTEKPPEKDDYSAVYAKYTDDTEDLSIESGYGILIDLDSNKVIASKGGDEKIFPASMTKVMTLIVAYENIKDLDNTTYTFDAVMLDELFLANASVAGFKAGETVTARDLLYGAILPSGGDATNALADLVAGGEEEFAELMNEKAEDLGLKSTHFVTASGLHDPDHYSTCHDMAIILRYAISKPEMRKILSTFKYTTSKTEQHPDGIELKSTLFTRMAGDEVDGLFVQGGKTGYTIEAKNCLCTFAANCREDEAAFTAPRYILVTASAAGDEYGPVFDAIDVYEKYCSN